MAHAKGFESLIDFATKKAFEEPKTPEEFRDKITSLMIEWGARERENVEISIKLGDREPDVLHLTWKA